VTIKEYFVPTYNRSRGRIKYGVIHHISVKNIPGYKSDPYNIDRILKFFEDEGSQYKFSCHYIIDRTGNIYQLVRLKNTAWHAGKSVLAIPNYEENINDISVGVEMVGMTGDTFTDEQYNSLAELSTHIEDQVRDLNLGNIEHWVGHDWISGVIAHKLDIRDDIKVDPGNFDWSRFNYLRIKNRVYNEVWSKCKVRLRQDIESDIRRIFKNKLTIKELLSLLIKKVI
jgi:N-acetyl-anhydromuramyl-L-alanine amidase AmpD